uniref:hypothetical protein n=1 Tax=uncultured Draconibacterium sp. TaxID=1573823 RepID=UPI003217C9A2
MHKRGNIPVCRELVQTVRAGFLALDVSVQNEILGFIKSRQNKNGAFVDRAQNPDLYYSLFGFWLSSATEQKELINNLAEYVSQKNETNTNSPVEYLALLLIQSELDATKKKFSIFRLFSILFKKGRSIEFSYQFFLLSLVIDSTSKNKKLYFFLARIWLFFYKPKGTIPCSLSAALIYARKIVGLNTSDLHDKLIKYLLESGGFRAFKSVKTSDTLSTGVALFVLNKTQYDLRMIAPANLDFIQENYSAGAFLSGDGDPTKDLEYTFYGLLALGSLIIEY